MSLSPTSIGPGDQDSLVAVNQKSPQFILTGQSLSSPVVTKQQYQNNISRQILNLLLPVCEIK